METNKTKLEHVEAWKISGLTRVDYARKHRIKYGTFKGWVYNQEKNPQKVEWNPITISGEEKEEFEDKKSFLELRIGGKCRFELNLRIRL